MSSSRKLRVLLIHDNVDLGHSAQVILRSPHYTLLTPNADMQRPYLSSYADVIASLRATLSGGLDHAGHEDAQLPDILIIDCNFDEDKQAPDLMGGTIDDPDMRYDPRGLLYGAIWAAYMAGKGTLHPFTFVLYSQAVDQIEHDGLGLTFFGLLLAIAEPGESSTAASNSQGAEVQRLRRTLPRYIQRWNTSDVVEMGTQQYRARLLQMSRDNYLDFEATSVERCLEAVRTYAKGGPVPSRDLFIEWRIRQQRDCVQLISLAPDALNEQIKWDRQRCGQVVDWLEEVSQDINWRQEKWKLLIDARDGHSGSKTAEIFSDLSTSSSERDGFRVLAILMVWSELSCCREAGLLKAFSGQDVLRPLGMETHQAQRPLRRFFDSKLTLGMFLRSVDASEAWPYPELRWLVPATSSYLRALSSSVGGTRPWMTTMGEFETCVPESAFAKDYWPRVLR